MIKHLITHSGRFHADDVCAAAVLSHLYPDAALIRTRDDALMEQLQDVAVFFDVGREYDPARGRFDHHMRDAPEREDGTPYSAFGLIWKNLGEDYLRIVMRSDDPAVLREIHDRIDQELVLPVDMIDNGKLSPSDLGVAAGISFPQLVDGMNPPFDPEADETLVALRADNAFRATSFIFGKMLRSRVADLEAGVTARHGIKAAIQEQWGHPILELETPGDAQKVIDELEARHVLMIVQPSSSGGYGLTVGRTCAGSYDNLVDLPAEWGGLTGEELEQVSGVEGATFCHRALFFAATRDKHAALSLARIALEGPDTSPSP